MILFMSSNHSISTRLRSVRPVFALGMMLVFLSGCALVDRVTENVKMQAVTVVTPMADGTSCEINDARGNRYTLEETPGVVTVRQGFSPLTFICKKPGYKTTVAYLDDDRLAGSTINLTDEVAGMITNPLAHSATEYPRETAIWMEPEHWKSKQQIRDWAFERSLYEHQLYLIQQKKEEAYRRREEERKFFKNWANNRHDKWERLENEKYGTRPETEFDRADKEKEFKQAVEDWGAAFERTFKRTQRKIVDGDWNAEDMKAEDDSSVEQDKPQAKDSEKAETSQDGDNHSKSEAAASDSDDNQPGTVAIFHNLDKPVRQYPTPEDESADDQSADSSDGWGDNEMDTQTDEGVQTGDGQGKVQQYDDPPHRMMRKQESIQPQGEELRVYPKRYSIEKMKLDPEAVARWKKINP